MLSSFCIQAALLGETFVPPTQKKMNVEEEEGEAEGDQKKEEKREGGEEM